MTNSRNVEVTHTLCSGVGGLDQHVHSPDRKSFAANMLHAFVPSSSTTARSTRGAGIVIRRPDPQSGSSSRIVQSS